MIRCKTADCDIICLKKKGRPCDEQVAARAPEAVDVALWILYNGSTSIKYTVCASHNRALAPHRGRCPFLFSAHYTMKGVQNSKDDHPRATWHLI